MKNLAESIKEYKKLTKEKEEIEKVLSKGKKTIKIGENDYKINYLKSNLTEVAGIQESCDIIVRQSFLTGKKKLIEKKTGEYSFQFNLTSTSRIVRGKDRLKIEKEREKVLNLMKDSPLPSQGKS